jgi:SAM-dependent methyltransferase
VLESEAWRGRTGALWASHADALDQQLEPAGDAGLKALDARPGERVLDLGCGSGATTAKLWDAVAPHGSVVGVDISPDQIEVARRRVKGGARFEVADAQTFPFERNSFDALFSRFGCMFFDDPDAAFRNLFGALGPEGRAVLVVWREIGLNPWAALPAGVGAELFGPEEPASPGAPGLFGWAAPSVFEPILRNAGFRDVAWTEVDMTLTIGEASERDPIEGAAKMLLRVGPLARRLRDRPDEARVEAGRRLAPRLRSYVNDGRVRIPGAIWVVRARC